MSSTFTTETRGYAAEKGAILNRLRRIEGQLRGVGRMVDEDRYCIDVLTQIGAVQRALDGVALRLLDGHIRHCIAGGEPAALGMKAAEVVGALGGSASRPRHTAEKPALRRHLDHAARRVTGLIGMVDADRYCIDVLTEMDEVKKALDAVALGLVEGHIRTCMTSARPEERDQKTRELMAAVGRLVKTS
jgi:DNA-binding FrmR family transcriptional regulator